MATVESCPKIHYFFFLHQDVKKYRSLMDLQSHVEDREGAMMEKSVDERVVKLLDQYKIHELDRESIQVREGEMRVKARLHCGTQLVQQKSPCDFSCEWRTFCGTKGPSTLAFFASVSPSAIAPLPNIFLCFSRT
jgi:hypothetical protein